MHYKFTGKERDSESGLDYFGARYYASNVGRWISADWAQKPEAVPYSKLDDPQSLNLYEYVGNNPLSKADADGHQAEQCTCQQFPNLEATKYDILDAIKSIPISIHWQPGNQLIPGLPIVTFTKNSGAAATEEETNTRHGAMNDAKRDAGVPTSQQPSKQETVPLKDQSGKQVVVNGKPQTTREYTHTTGDGKQVVIQDHGQGHTFPDGGSVGPHINVRPAGDTAHGQVEGTKPHYPYQP